MRTQRRNARPRRGQTLFGILALVAVTAARAAEPEPTTPSTRAAVRPTIGEAAVGTLDTPVGPLAYTPGRGLRVGRTGLTLGGFTNIKAEHEEESGGEFTVDLLNFFLIHDYFPRFRTVAELQLKDVFVADREHSTGTTQDFAFDVRRLFGDFTIADALHIQAGTFLTPVGRWNLILTPPLTWTTEKPVIVEETFFDETTTGPMLHGALALPRGQLSYALFSQVIGPLEDDPELDPVDHTGGARIEYALAPGRAIGASYLATDEDDDWSHLGGLHFLWQQGRVELLGELFYQEGSGLRAPEEDEPGEDDEEDEEEDDDEDDEDGDDDEDEDPESTAGAARGHTKQWGAYLQGVVNVYGPFYLVGRYEYFDPPRSATPLHLFTPALVYKPLPFMALKVEYRFTDQRNEDNPEGLFASFTTLF
jgi:hypothetical protein